MKTVIRISILVVALVLTNVNAQNFKGIATYKTQRAVSIELDTTKKSGMTKDMQSQIRAMLKKQFQKTYKLSFDKSISIYKQEESLAGPKVGGSGMQLMAMGSGGGSDILFKNTKNNTYIDQKDTMGKIFLVKDTIAPIKWQLEKETKFIGQYQSFKATYIKKVPKPKDFRSINNNKMENNEIEKIERTVTAWYTPQIPVSNGPAMYQGLPGLILEVHDGKLNIVCSNIILNPKDKIEIKAPKKGKKVNQKQYNIIREKKNKEMMERYAPSNGRDNGERYQIKIGG